MTHRSSVSSKATETQRRPALTDQQRAAIEERRVSVALSAGAGCGKTFVLTQRFLSHLQPGHNPSDLNRLVAITFTERAAREMRDRIRAECRRRLESCPAGEVNYWLTVVREMDTARISTIHSFCASLLRANAIEAGVDPRFGLLEETTGGAFLRSSVAAALHSLLAEHDDDAMELVLELGLERTDLLIERLIPNRYRIDFEEWENVAAEDLARRWENHWLTVALPGLLSDVANSDLVRRTAALLRENTPKNPAMQERSRILLEELPNLPKSSDAIASLETLIEAARVQGGGGKSAWDDDAIYAEILIALADLRKLLEKTLDQTAYEPAHLLRSAEIGLRMARVVRRAGNRYDDDKRHAGLLDFDDLLLLTRNLLRDHPQVCKRVAAGVDLLMVDEFQDTDPIQTEIVRKLCGAAIVDGKLFLVGDAKQSIYRFRRAEPRVFHELRQEIPAKGRLPLSVNFRSQPQILWFVNTLFDGTLAGEYEPLTPHHKQLTPPPVIEFLFSAAPDDEAARGDDAPAAARRRREGDWIARRVKQLLTDKVPRIHCSSQGATEDGLRAAEPRDVIILFRAMTDIRHYEEALRKYGLEYYVVGGQAFFAQQEVFDLINLCRFLNDVDDEVALVGVLRSPFFSLSDDALYALALQAAENRPRVPQSLPLLASLALPPPPHLSELQQARIRFAGEVLADLRARKDRLPISQLLQLAIDRTGYDAALLTEFLGSRKLANLRKLIDLARKLDQAGLFTLADFTDRLRDALEDETREPLAATHPESSNVIRLMSIHQSKGLEFPVVVLADMDRRGNDMPESAVFDPHFGPLVALPKKFGVSRDNLGLKLHRLAEQPEHLSENLRLLYVAGTRAADLLILSANLRKPGHVSSAWLRLLAERFDLNTGQPRSAPTAAGTSILVKYSKQLPDIRVHRAAPELVPVAARNVGHLPLKDFSEILVACDPLSLPETLRAHSPDHAARLRFSVSELETVDAETPISEANLKALAESLKPTVKRFWNVAPVDSIVLSSDDNEILGNLTHAALERVSFSAPVDVAILVNSCCGDALRHVRTEIRSSAVAFVAAFLKSPVAAELATALPLHRELEFLLRWPTNPSLPRIEGRRQLTVPRLIAGTIDCLYRSAAGAEIILDYKAGGGDAIRLPDEKLIRRTLRKYGFQLGVYALAARQFFHKLPARLDLLYVSHGICVSLHPSDEFLNRITDRIGQTLARVIFGETADQLAP